MRLLAFTVLFAVIVLAGCKPSGGTATAAPGTAAGTQGGAETVQWGRLEFSITAVHEGQLPAEEYPGHQDGGQWTFFDCTTENGATFVVGVAVPADTNPTIASRGQAVIRTPDREATDSFLSAFAKGFHTAVPAPQTPKPVRPVVFETRILGTAMTRNQSGTGFTLGGGGSWVAMKWFPTTPRLNAEVYFNFDLKAGRGEFVELDLTHRENLLALWARILRDGPRGQRTPQEDRNIVTWGPRLDDLRRIAGPEARQPFFVPGGKWLIYTLERPDMRQEVWAAPCANLDNRKRLGEFQQVVYQVQSADPAAQRFLVEEKAPDVPGNVTSADPSVFWWVDSYAGTAKVLQGPWNNRNVDCPPRAISPDSRYVVVLENRAQFTQLFVADVQTHTAATLDINRQWLEPVGWHGEGEDLRLVVRTGLLFDPAEKRVLCLVNPASGDWEAARPTDVPAFNVSPNGMNAAVVLDRSRLEIRTRGGLVRSLSFHPEDRLFVDEQSVEWLDNRYLSFFNPYPIIIDVQTMKMNYALSNDLVPNNVHYSPGFKYAALEFSDALVLGTVTNADNP